MDKKVWKKSQYRKLLTGLLAITAIVVMMLMVGCGNDEALVGRWVFADDPSYVTTFNADGTGTHAISWGQGTSFRWSTPGNNIMWDFPGYANSRSPYSISGDVLYITVQDGVVYRYIRDN